MSYLNFIIPKRFMINGDLLMEQSDLVDKQENLDEEHKEISIGFLFSMAYVILTSSTFSFFFLDGSLWPTIFGFATLGFIFISFLLELTVGTVVRSSILIVKDRKKARNFFIISFCANSLTVICYLIIILYNPNDTITLLNFIYWPSHPLIISIPASIIIIVKKQTLVEWFTIPEEKVTNLSKKERKIILIAKILVILTYISIAPNLILTAQYGFSYFFLISIISHYLCVIGFEILTTQLFKMKKTQQSL